MENLDKYINKTISEARLEGSTLVLKFNDNTKIELYDNGQSCCESRYMHTDDDLSYYSDSVLLGIELLNGCSEGDNHDIIKESQFLHVKTSKGTFTMVNYNEHNGYYGGFSIDIKEL